MRKLAAMPDWIEELLDRHGPALVLLFERHRVPPERAGAILDRALAILARKRHDLESPEQWLTEMVLELVGRDERDQLDAPDAPDAETRG